MTQDIRIASRADVEQLSHALTIGGFRYHVHICSTLLTTAERIRLERKIERILSMCGCTSGGVTATFLAVAALSWRATQLRLDFNSVVSIGTTTLVALVLGGIAGKLIGMAVQRVRLKTVRKHLLCVFEERNRANPVTLKRERAGLNTPSEMREPSNTGMHGPRRATAR